MRQRVGLVLIVVGLLAGGAPVAGAQADLDRRIQAAAQTLASGDALAAFLELEAVLAKDDTLWAAYFHRGRAQVQMGDDLGARASFRRAAELNPGNADLHFLIATAALELADFDTGWAQAIAAHQAGYDPAIIDAMFKQMTEWVPPPADLQQRLAAPKVVVVAEGADDEALEDTARALRSMLAHAPLVALVQDASKARYRVELSRPGPERLSLRAVEIIGGRVLGTRDTTLPADGPDATTDLALSAFATDLERWLAEGA